MPGNPLVEEVVVSSEEELIIGHDSPTLSLTGLTNRLEDSNFHASSPCSLASPSKKRNEKKKTYVEDMIDEELGKDLNTSSSSCEDGSEEQNSTCTSSGIGTSLDTSSGLCSSISSDEQTLKRLNISHMLQVMKERLNVSDDHGSNQDSPGLRSYLLNTSWLCTSQSEDSDSVSDLSVSTGDGFEEFYKRYRCSEIQKELRMMTCHHQDGVYVAPSLKSIEMWFGVMFIRDGPYKDAIFHFTVYFSDDFPEERPTLKFKSPVFHPQIKSRKGTLNLGPMYTKSKDTRVFVWEIIKYARSCFYHLNVTDAYNPEAAHIFQTDLKTFKARCRNSVLDSLLEFEEQKHALDHQSENPFRGTIIENGLCSAVRKALTCADSREEVGKYGMFGWAKSQLGKVLNNIHANFDDTEQII